MSLSPPKKHNLEEAEACYKKAVVIAERLNLPPKTRKEYSDRLAKVQNDQVSQDSANVQLEGKRKFHHDSNYS